MNRRTFITSVSAGAVLAAGGLMYATSGGRSEIDVASRNRLTMPPLLDARGSGRFELTAQLDNLTLSPGERAEVLVDFSAGGGMMEQFTVT